MVWEDKSLISLEYEISTKSLKNINVLLLLWLKLFCSARQMGAIVSFLRMWNGIALICMP